VNSENKIDFHPSKNGIKMKKITFISALNAGKNTFRIIPHGKGCLILDYMDVSKTP